MRQGYETGQKYWFALRIKGIMLASLQPSPLRPSLKINSGVDGAGEGMPLTVLKIKIRSVALSSG